MQKNQWKIPNVYDVGVNLANIKITRKDGSQHLTLIDAEDVPKTKCFNWCINHGYIRTYIPNTTKVLFLAHLLLGFRKESKNVVIDHINGNPLDNRKANLRVVSQSVNVRNRHTPPLNKHGHVGIIQDGKRWRAFIKVDGKLHWSRRQPTKQAAILAREVLEAEF